MRYPLFVGVWIGGIALMISPVRAQECVPTCRTAYVCIDGQCVSACNPPCEAGEKCTPEGSCEAAAPAPAPPPAQAAPAEQAGPAWGTAQQPPSQAHGPPPAPPHTEAGGPGTGAELDYQAPGFSFLFRFGPSIGWFAGGHIELGLAIGLAEGVYLVPSVRGGGGMSVDGDAAFAVGGGDVSVRFLRWGAVGGVGQVGLGATFMHEFEGSYDYQYVAPHIRLGGGILFGSPGRFAWGVEATARLGYAINTYSDWDDYSGFYGVLDFSLVLTL
jgi:hypothetical protein